MKSSWIVFPIVVLAACLALLIISSGYKIPQVQTHCVNEKPEPMFGMDKEEVSRLLISKNIFFPEHKEVEVKAVVSTTTTNKKQAPSIIYKGIMLWDGTQVGIFYDVEKKKTLFLKTGEFIRDYKILDITAEEVVLSKRGGLSVVTLKIGGLGGL